MKAKSALAVVLLLGGLALAAAQKKPPPPMPGYCYDTKCRGAFCLHGETGEATYCLGPKGFPSSKEEENGCFCHVQLRYDGTDKSPDGHLCWRYKETGIPFPLEWCFEQRPEKQPEDKNCPYRVWVRCTSQAKWKLWSDAARCAIRKPEDAKALREKACKALD